MKGYILLKDILAGLAIVGLLLAIVSTMFYLAVIFVLLQAITHR